MLRICANRRRAGSIKPGESLTLTFADGEARAVTGPVSGEGETKPKNPRKKTPADQGSLF